MKWNRYIGFSVLTAGLIAVASCSDFSDYNDVPVDELATGNQTLWENISQNPQLSDFAALLKRTGFDVELSNTRSYTVWAPLNNTFDAGAFASLSDSALLQQFVKNHVAEYSHVASGRVNERIHTLNKKSYTFEGNGTYSFADKTISKPNVPSNNGVMHLLDGQVRFYPNLYEYLSMGDNIELLSAQFMRYELSTLDTKNSVKGPVVGGMQTYIDSVIVTTNTLTRSLNASLANEDSSYTFLMPTDKAFMAMYNKVKPLFNFISKTTVQDVENFGKANDSQTKSVTVDAAYLSDSLTRRVITADLIYSNNDAYNQWLVGNGPETDTLRSTTRGKFSNPHDILDQTVERVELSNGYAHIVDSLAFLPWETYNFKRDINPLYYAYSSNSKDRFSYSTRTVRVPDSVSQKMFDPQVTNFRYMWMYPTSDYAKPEVYIELPGVLSTTYKFYCVFLPDTFKMSDDSYVVLGSDGRPNILNFQLSYCNAKGNLATYSFSSKFLNSGVAKDENPSKVDKTTAFINDTTKVDTVYLGQFTFPVAYNGLGDYSPNIHISNPIGVFNANDMRTYTRDIRIAAIIMKPVEMEEYEEKQ